jgi:hypothetical protein
MGLHLKSGLKVNVLNMPKRTKEISNMNMKQTMLRTMGCKSWVIKLRSQIPSSHLLFLGLNSLIRTKTNNPKLKEKCDSIIFTRKFTKIISK